MRFLRVAALIVIGLSVVVSAARAGEGSIRRMPNPVKGSYIVTVSGRDLDVAAEAANMARSHGGSVSAILHSIDGFVIHIPDVAAESLSKNPKVKYIEEVAKVRITDGML